MLPQWFMAPSAPGLGPDTSVGLIPQPNVLLFYGVFFWLGAAYHSAGDVHGRLGRWW